MTASNSDRGHDRWSQIEQIELTEGRHAELVRLGRPDGTPVLYFHSPATSGEELRGAAELAADDWDLQLLGIVRRSLADRKRIVALRPAIGEATRDDLGSHRG